MKTPIEFQTGGLINKRSFSLVSYKNGKDILPPELLREVQKYIQGELIYIPKSGDSRAGWGEMNGTRNALEGRNMEIYFLYKSGFTVDNLIEKYHLSEDSIRRIVTKTNSRLEGVCK
jgi:Mor family transcriptional regulator